MNITTITKENNFFYLFFALVFMLLSSSLVAQLGEEEHHYLFEFLTIGMLLLSLKSLKNDKTWFWAVGILAMTSVVLFVSNRFFTIYYTEFITLLIWAIFFIGCFKVLVKSIINSKQIDQNMIVGSMVLYLLIGLLYTSIYLFILRIVPNSFHGLEFTSLSEDFSIVTYYSFVTLTTLGYGDIYPQEPIARFFVISESIVGVFYIAIIVSSLVSARLGSISKN
ncbi:MAG TPA: two pore domain potassium channel family protein [Sulfurospirillum arcachonense]|nr:two pore domain potassium channel family protein [Sulfurospirillum arcachonense]HIP45138.1 two pore domain potassium channel family protein [Sulfurospirillum arcachonense]